MTAIPVCTCGKPAMPNCPQCATCWIERPQDRVWWRLPFDGAVHDRDWPGEAVYAKRGKRAKAG